MRQPARGARPRFDVCGITCSDVHFCAHTDSLSLTLAKISPSAFPPRPDRNSHTSCSLALDACALWLGIPPLVYQEPFSTKSPSAAGQQGHIGAQSRRRTPFECAAQIKQINVRTSSGTTGVCLRAHTAGLPPPRSRAVPEAGSKGKSVAQESEQQQKSKNKEPAMRQERGGYGKRVNARESPPQSRGYQYGRGPLGHCPCAPRRWRP